MKLFLGAGVFSCLLVRAQSPMSAMTWAGGQVESVASPTAQANGGNPAFVLAKSFQVHYQPTVPGFRSIDVFATGKSKNMGWSGALGTRGNALLAQQKLRFGLAAQRDKFQLGIRAGLHVWQHQHPDYPTYWVPSFELGATYQVSSQWQTGFSAGGDAWNRYWCVGLAYRPSEVWQGQLEWNGGIRGGIHYVWRPEWTFHAGVVQRSLRTGLTWHSASWHIGAAIARWPEGWFTSTYSLIFQP